jgi:hypothetical protein
MILNGLCRELAILVVSKIKHLKYLRIQPSDEYFSFSYASQWRKRERQSGVFTFGRLRTSEIHEASPLYLGSLQFKSI